nr:unnamed protein product [Spirometra erinaceieuropaei]
MSETILRFIAALGNKFHKLPDPTSSRGSTLVHNLSSKELTKEQVQVLLHEASFNTADAKPLNMIAAVESVINQTEAAEETKNLIRHQVSSLLMTHKPREILPKVERDVLRELKADKDIVIVPADKGRSAVVLDRTDYLQKAKNLLEDRQFYVPCETNPVKTLTREINATLLALENSGAITPTDRRMARAQETALVRFYGLPKFDDSIALVSADRDGANVTRDKSEPVNKNSQVFTDREAYIPSVEDPKKKQAAAVKKVNELTRQKLLSPEDSNFMTLSDIRVAHAYGLPKRPVPACHSTDDEVGRWLTWRRSPSNARRTQARKQQRTHENRGCVSGSSGFVVSIVMATCLSQYPRHSVTTASNISESRLTALVTSTMRLTPGPLCPDIVAVITSAQNKANYAILITTTAAKTTLISTGSSTVDSHDVHRVLHGRVGAETVTCA